MKSIAAQVREQKMAHPEMYCAEPRCLFRIRTRHGVTPCPKHPVVPVPATNEQSTEASA